MMPATLDTLTLRGARDAPALAVAERIWTHADLAGAAAGWAEMLAGARVGVGDRVALYGPKSPEIVAALFGVWAAGAVAVPINPVLRAPQVTHILADSGARLLIAPDARLDGLATSAPATPMPLRPVVPAERRTCPVAAHALAALLYTSGSTGSPKGVMLSHANLWLGADSVTRYQGLAADDVALAVLPLSFDAGLSVVTSALMAGGCAALLEYLTPRDVVAAVARHAVTTLPGVPPLFVQLAQAHWPEGAGASLRRLTVTGGRMPASVARRLRERFPHADLHLMYGLTEAFRSLSLPPALADAHPDSVGGAIPYAEIALVRPDGARAADGEPGELVHTGPLVAGGYWNAPERTAARFRPAPAWMGGGTAVWSGDTLIRDAAGLYYFVGRDDDMIKTSGLRVSPTDVEEAAVATGAVREAAAFGVADEALGQSIVLVAAASGDDASARLAAGLAAALPAYMRPARVLWLDQLPRSPNGKIDRATLKAGLT